MVPAETVKVASSTELNVLYPIYILQEGIQLGTRRSSRQRSRSGRDSEGQLDQTIRSQRPTTR